MNEDGDGTQPTSPARTTLAASTLRALRARRAPAAPSDVEPQAVEPQTVEPQTVEPQTHEPQIVEPQTHEPQIVEPQTHEPPASDASEAVEAVVPSEHDQRADVVEGRPDRPVDHREEADRAAEADALDARPADGATAGHSQRGGLITGACALLAAAALVFAVVAGVVWWTAGHSGRSRLGVARDVVSTDARLAIVTVNTSDYRHPSAALSNWLEVSTGSLHSQFSQSRTAAIKLLDEAKTVTKAIVLDAAVTSIDLAKGSATVIASVNVVRRHDGAASTVRNRFRATMTRVGGQWKLSNLAVVAVSLS